jgi:tryptophan synthase beta chain
VTSVARGEPVFLGPPGPEPVGLGRFGDGFGGRFVPESLVPALEEIEREFRAAWSSDTFRAEFAALLQSYAGRPTPITECHRLSEQLGVRVILKREDLTHTGSHKINNVLGQALLTRQMGKKRMIAETGAGQHGVATATAAALFGLECIVFMGAVDVERQSLNVFRMQLLGAEVIPVHSGSATLKDAINDALRDWVATVESTHYCIGSVVGPHPYPWLVREFQRVVGDEAREQCREHGASETRGVPGVLHGARSLFLQDEHGQILEAHSISAGLDYPGVGPEHAALAASGRAQYGCATDDEALDAFQALSVTEGIVPALEPAHALAWIMSAARDGSLEPGSTVLLTMSGRGDKDAMQVAERLSGDKR